MKATKLVLLLAIALITFSCGDDEPVKSELEEIRLSLADKTEIIKLPTGLITSTNPYAQEAYSYAASANMMTSYFSFLSFPDGASKTKNPIVPANARTSDAGDYLVYTWSDASVGSIAYQLGDLGDSYSFEIFFKEPGSSDWLRYFYAEEKKDQSSGFMKIYNIYGDDPSFAFVEYSWVRVANVLTFEYKFLFDDEPALRAVITINETTGAGQVVYFSGSLQLSRITWDALGNGTWQTFDGEGNLDDSGSWDAGD